MALWLRSRFGAKHGDVQENSPCQDDVAACSNHVGKARPAYSGTSPQEPAAYGSTNGKAVLFRQENWNCCANCHLQRHCEKLHRLTGRDLAGTVVAAVPASAVTTAAVHSVRSPVSSGEAAKGIGGHGDTDAQGPSAAQMAAAATAAAAAMSATAGTLLADALPPRPRSTAGEFPLALCLRARTYSFPLI